MKHNARKNKTKARKSHLANNGMKQMQFSNWNSFKEDLQKMYLNEDESLLNDWNEPKFGVFAQFHHSDGNINTLRCFGSQEDYENVAKKVDKNDSLGFLCKESKKDNFVNNELGAKVLLTYAAQSQTYQLGKMMYDDLGLIMNFYIDGNKFSCRDCGVIDFDAWVKASREMQLEGGVNHFGKEKTTPVIFVD